jgi:hypothetical protein
MPRINSTVIFAVNIQMHSVLHFSESAPLSPPSKQNVWPTWLPLGHLRGDVRPGNSHGCPGVDGHVAFAFSKSSLVLCVLPYSSNPSRLPLRPSSRLSTVSSEVIDVSTVPAYSRPVLQSCGTWLLVIVSSWGVQLLPPPASLVVWLSPSEPLASRSG